MHVVNQMNILSTDHPIIFVYEPTWHAVPVVHLTSSQVLPQALLVPCRLQLAYPVEVVYAAHHVSLVVVSISAQPWLEISSRRGSILLVDFCLTYGELLNGLWSYG